MLFTCFSAIYFSLCGVRKRTKNSQLIRVSGIGNVTVPKWCNKNDAAVGQG